MTKLLLALLVYLLAGFVAAEELRPMPRPAPDAGPILRSAPRTSACAKREDVVQRLDAVFGEDLRSLGLQPNGSVIELYSTADGATWTLLLSKPDGTTCLLGTGTMWEHNVKPLHPPGEPL
jgi:hypothetical protein